MDDSVIKILNEEFPPEKIKQRPGAGGRKLSYIASFDCIKRLNEAFGQEWRFEIKSHEMTEGSALVLGKLTAGDVVKEQFGSSLLKGKEIGDAFKSAGSDALKKCASLLGVGLHLYDGTPKSPPKPVPAPKPVELVSESRLKFVKQLIIASGRTVKEIEDKNFRKMETLTAKEVESLIDKLKEQ